MLRKIKESISGARFVLLGNSGSMFCYDCITFGERKVQLSNLTLKIMDWFFIFITTTACHAGILS